MLRVARFLRSYHRPSPRTAELEVTVPMGGEDLPATLLLPRSRRAVPGWVVLHGITVPGRHHPGLQRFTRALAGSGCAVLIPEIDAWRELRIAPLPAERTIAAAARFLAGRPEITPDGVGVVGFSFGATQALITAARSELDAPIRSLVGFGGYCELERVVRFMFTGEHEWRGTRYRLEPDPYGRWIVVGNYLTAVPEYAGFGAVAAGALELALEAGRLAVAASDPGFDARKAEIGAALSREEREVWELVAPRTGRAPDRHAAEALAARLVEAALRVEPDLDPRPYLPGARGRVVLAHGFQDQLIPFSESLRLRDALPAGAVAHTCVTRLFAHSRGAGGLRAHEYPLEVVRYLRLLQRAFAPA